jgi:hypothetical protein
MSGATPKRIDVGGVTLAWGSPTGWKAVLREESRRRRKEQPLPERLRAALALVRPRQRRVQPG